MILCSNKEQLFIASQWYLSSVYNSKNWSNIFKLKVSDQIQICPIEGETKQI